MPTYEMILLLRQAERSVVKSALKRSAEYIFESGGIIRRMENLGLMELPFKIALKKQPQTSANCFLLQYDANLEKIPYLREKFRLDADVVRATSYREAVSREQAHEPKKRPECNAYLNDLPPPFRPNVIALQKTWKEPKKFDYGPGLEYNPI